VKAIVQTTGQLGEEVDLLEEALEEGSEDSMVDRVVLHLPLHEEDEVNTLIALLVIQQL